MIFRMIIQFDSSRESNNEAGKLVLGSTLFCVCAPTDMNLVSHVRRSEPSLQIIAEPPIWKMAKPSVPSTTDLTAKSTIPRSDDDSSARRTGGTGGVAAEINSSFTAWRQ